MLLGLLSHDQWFTLLLVVLLLLLGHKFFGFTSYYSFFLQTLATPLLPIADLTVLER